MRRLIHHLLVWGAASASRPLLRSLLGMARRTALDTALGAAVDTVPRPVHRSHVQVFNITPPSTVYLRASYCQVTVQRTDLHKVTLEANLAGAFGLELATEQDEAGVYIIVHRKPVVGQLARVTLTLTVPSFCHLAFHLTPGDVVLQSLHGVLELPPNLVAPETESGH